MILSYVFLMEAFITLQNFSIVCLSEILLNSSTDISDTRINLNVYSLLWADPGCVKDHLPLINPNKAGLFEGSFSWGGVISIFNWTLAFQNKDINEKTKILTETLMNIFNNFIPNRISKFDRNQYEWITRLPYFFQ